MEEREAVAAWLERMTAPTAIAMRVNATMRLIVKPGIATDNMRQGNLQAGPRLRVQLQTVGLFLVRGEGQ